IQMRKTLKPSTPTPNHLRSLKLSLFDQLAPGEKIIHSSLQFVHMFSSLNIETAYEKFCVRHAPVLFHYLPSSGWNRKENTERCNKLQKSLAEMLAKFYPLAGRYRKDDLSIHCNDEGVEYVETKVNTDLAEFLHEGPNNIELFDDHLPWRVPLIRDLSSSPLLGIQVNKFNCGGLVMGIQISHILADGFTLGTFVNEWAHINKTGTTKGCVPSFDQLSSLFPARVLPEPQFSLPSNMSAKIVTRRFMFDALAIAELKDKIDSNSVTVAKSTRMVFVMALIWKVLTSISSAKHGHSRDSTLIFAMNLRGKTKLPSLEHALGNFCAAGFPTRGKPCLGCNPLVQKDEMDIYLCSSLCRFPWYEADFGQK
ncbi:acetyl-CoA-benzylalcohol acetyltransferase-like, partial [Lycium ferocissimum]|uniref:acetyl-CoA-benzylalcohol acetyltransferase-like n=1 Tax=Lycium ferocissimum TaxID=112874 RepID=UPI00281504F6